MGLFSNKNGPVIAKETSDAKRQICALESLLPAAPAEIKPQIEQDIKLLSYGIYGEDKILFELKNSHMPMYVLHDLYLEDEGLTAQIDFLIITEKVIFIVECKNLVGNIEINSNGDFIRTINYGKTYKKEGIYSPITQNRRHIELIKQIRIRAKSNFVTKALLEKYFYTRYRGIVVLANPKTVLNDKYAKQDIKEQVIRVDQLVERLRQINAKSKYDPSSDKEIAELAEFFLSAHKENSTDYLAKYKINAANVSDPAEEKLEQPLNEPMKSQNQEEAATAVNEQIQLCPKCGTPMILRTATKGERVGKKFWGCANYPKCRSIVNVDD